MRSEPYQDVKERMVWSTNLNGGTLAYPCLQQAAGDVVSCLATRLLAQEDLPWEGTGLTRDEFVQDCCGVVYSGKGLSLAMCTRLIRALLRSRGGYRECSYFTDRMTGC